jgi:hypothetical protein
MIYPKEMLDTVGQDELDAKVKFGSIIKEPDPQTEEGSGIFRYRHCTVEGSSVSSITKTKEKREEVGADEARGGFTNKNMLETKTFFPYLFIVGLRQTPRSLTTWWTPSSRGLKGSDSRRP